MPKQLQSPIVNVPDPSEADKPPPTLSDRIPDWTPTSVAHAVSYVIFAVFGGYAAWQGDFDWRVYGGLLGLHPTAIGVAHKLTRPKVVHQVTHTTEPPKK